MTASGHRRSATHDAPSDAGVGDPANETGRRAAERLFNGPGEVRAIARMLDWGATPLGWPDRWPAALRIMTRAILDATHPVCLWSGPELALVYNDAYRRILAAKHPASLGQPGAVVWAEIWDALDEQFGSVWRGGPPVHGEDARFVMARLEGGRTEDAWFSYSLSAVRDEDGQVVAVLNISPETTGRVRAEHALAVERERLRSVVLRAPVPMALHEGPEHRYVLVNEAYRRVSGNRDVTGLTLREAFPDIGGQGIYEAFDHVYTTGEWWAGRETHLRYDRRGKGVEDAWFDLRYEATRDADGRVTGVLNFSLDITDQVRARHEVEALLAESVQTAAALAESEHRFRTVQDASPLGFAIHRPVYADGDTGAARDPVVVDFTIPYLNEAGARIVGQSREAIMAGTLLGVWPATAREGVFEEYVRVLRTGTPSHRELLYQHDELVAGLALTTARIGEGRGAELAITFTDITARLRADAERSKLVAELGAERERLRSVILHMPSPLALHVGPEHRFELVNAAFRRISGGGRDDTGRTVREAFPELLGQGIIEALDRVYATGEPWIGAEVPIRYDRDGKGLQDTWYNVRYEPVRDGDGKVWGVLNFAVDVTDQVLARRAVEGLLATSERTRAEADLERRRLETVLDQLPVGVHVAEAPSGRLVRDNAAVRAICGEAPRSDGVEEYSADYAGHYPPNHPRAGEPLPSDAWPLARTLATGAPADEELVEIRRADGTRRLAAISATPVRDADGQVVGAVATSVDVTEQARLLAEAEAARTEAESANRAKSEFLTVMSHELRTPLNAIDGYAELIELGIRGPVTDEQRHDLARIRRSQKHLLGLINGVLNYARVEAGAVHYEMESVPLDEVLVSCEALTLPQVRNRNLSFERLACDPAIRVRADREKLQQIVLNLLSNAIKFTDAGGRITMRCDLAQEESGPAVHVHVEDTGIGIASTQLARIFEPFVQIDSELTRTRDGTGLGLAISRDLARGMGGELTAESTEGEGSVFTLTLGAG